MPDIRVQSTPAIGPQSHEFTATITITMGSRLLLSLIGWGDWYFKNNEYPTDEKDGHFINYSLDLLRGEAGSLGIDMLEIERKGFTLFNPFVVYFNDNVQEATHDAELILKMHTIKTIAFSWHISGHDYCYDYGFMRRNSKD